MCGQRLIYFIDATRGRCFLGETGLGEISMLVSACTRDRICHERGSFVNFCLRCVRIYVSVLPLLFGLSSPLAPFFLFFFFFFFFPYHNRGERFYLGMLQMIRFDQSIFRKLPSRGTNLSGGFLLY